MNTLHRIFLTSTVAVGLASSVACGTVQSGPVVSTPSGASIRPVRIVDDGAGLISGRDIVAGRASLAPREATAPVRVPDSCPSPLR